jgi:hypothetical protein
MGQPADKDVEDGQAPSDQPAGRVEHDARGKAVWRWASDLIENTSVLLKRLENRALALEPTAKVPVMREAKGAKQAGRGDAKSRAKEELSVEGAKTGRDTGGGFDPYNSR